MLLTLRDICHFYGPRLIFKDLNLELDRGETLLLAGPNGAGKSTLLRIMAGLVRPQAGTCQVAPEARLGYLGHHTFIYPDLSALENLRFWSALNGLSFSDKNLLDMLEGMELAAFADEKAGGFSRGMAQRLNLARVFLGKPDLLLLDEPGTGLDTRSMAVLRREIAAAASAGAGLVWISHSLDQDLEMAKTVALLDGKKLAFFGKATEYALFAAGREKLWEQFQDQQAGQEKSAVTSDRDIRRKDAPC